MTYPIRWCWQDAATGPVPCAWVVFLPGGETIEVYLLGE